MRSTQATSEPAVIASDCLFNSIRGGVGFAQLVYCTVLEDAGLTQLWASDCIFNGPLAGVDCTTDQSCIRFSRAADLGALLPAAPVLVAGIGHALWIDADGEVLSLDAREAARRGGFSIHFSQLLQEDLADAGVFVYLTKEEGLGSGELLADL